MPAITMTAISLSTSRRKRKAWRKSPWIASLSAAIGLRRKIICLIDLSERRKLGRDHTGKMPRDHARLTLLLAHGEQVVQDLLCCFGGINMRETFGESQIGGGLFRRRNKSPAFRAGASFHDACA